MSRAKLQVLGAAGAEYVSMRGILIVERAGVEMVDTLLSSTQRDRDERFCTTTRA